MHAQEMISAHPQARGKSNDTLIRCIEECMTVRKVARLALTRV